ncbi:hypothetical protein AB6N37_21560 [Salmonella enterica subsp. enterica serovar Infantis]|nr:hypothetical protein [Salmonella enterica subsp. enterica serovar Infantis]
MKQIASATGGHPAEYLTLKFFQNPVDADSYVKMIHNNIDFIAESMK